jgi:hypothetical protein
MLGRSEEGWADAIGTKGRDVEDVPRPWKFPLYGVFTLGSP